MNSLKTVVRADEVGEEGGVQNRRARIRSQMWIQLTLNTRGDGKKSSPTM